jgi:hypothetical protein
LRFALLAISIPQINALVADERRFGCHQPHRPPSRTESSGIFVDAAASGLSVLADSAGHW